MRIVILGSGGTGGYFGAKLARAGHDVVFVARGDHLQAIRENGLRIKSVVDGEWSVNAPAVATLDGQPVADLVLFCVKSFDTDSAAELVKPVLGSHTGVLSLQNGIDNEDRLARILGADHVIGGVAYAFSYITAPGVITHQQLARIVSGEFDGKVSKRLLAFAEACKSAGIQTEIPPRIRKSLWEKYVFLTAFAGATALTRMPVKVIREVPALRRLWQSQIDELLTLAKADAAGLDDNMMDRCVTFLDSIAPISYTSLYYDLMLGKRLELDALHGYAVRLGERYGIATPTLSAVYAGLLPYRDGIPQVVQDHQDGVLKNLRVHDVMDASDVGSGESRQVLGRHSGQNALRSKLEELGYRVSGEKLDHIFRRFKDMVDTQKAVSDAQLHTLCAELSLSTDIG